MRFVGQPAARWAAAFAGLCLVVGSVSSAAPKKDARAAAAAAEDPLRALLDGKTPQQKADFLNGIVDDGKASKDVYFHLGNAKYEMGDAAGAAAAFEKCVAMDSTFFKAIVNLGLMYDEQQLFPKAIEAFELAAKLQPQNPDVWANLGNSYYTQAQHPKAFEYYQKALALDPNSQSALYSMAVSFADAGIFREAVKYWQHVVDVDPKSEQGKNAAENIDLVKKYLIP